MDSRTADWREWRRNIYLGIYQSIYVSIYCSIYSHIYVPSRAILLFRSALAHHAGCLHGAYTGVANHGSLV